MAATVRPEVPAASRAAALVGRLTLDEKAALTAGVDSWHTAAIPRLGIPALRLSDGPSGARGDTSPQGVPRTPSICIPSGTALGATWDPDLVAEAAAAVARQALEKGARVLLAPTVNLHRHPLWGRNFEAFSEDPVLTARLAVAYIRAVQGAGVAATVKHLVGNESEFERNTASSDIDERTLRELYLLPFEHAVRVAGVLAVMTSYNRVNGCHVPDDARLLAGVLRGEWGFRGLVMTDWFGLSRTAEAARAGLDLEMPGPARSYGPALAAAVRAGEVEEARLDDAARHVLELQERVGGLDAPPGEEAPLDRPEDRALTRRCAAASIVLLANRGLLPLDAGALRRILVVGPNATRPAITGGGSALVVPHYRLTPLQVLRDRLGPGCEVVHEEGAGEGGIRRAAELARGADAVIAVVGTDPDVEGESFDRVSMDLPGDQDALVSSVCGANPRTVVVVNSGAPVSLPWREGCAALLQCYFAGQELSSALVDVLLGEADPGGRLPTTLPVRLEHAPAFGSFPSESSHVRYAEGPLIGYRWYEARHLPVAFPFGHGLSYTTFEIGPPKLSATTLGPGERLRVTVPVRNTGGRSGSEVVQLYVAPPGGGRRDPGGRLRPVKELRAFAKVHLAPGQAAEVELELGERAFAYWDVADADWFALQARHPVSVTHGHDAPLHRERAGWYVDPGVHRLLVGRSSADIAHAAEVSVSGGGEPLDPSLPPD